MNKIFRHLVYFFLFFIADTTFGQRISLGYKYGINIYQNLKLKDNYIFPKSSYYIYYSGNSKRDGKPSFGQIGNGGSVGLNLNLDYKRNMATVEVLAEVGSIKVPVYYPSSLGATLDNDHTAFNVSQTNWAIGFLMTTKLSTRANGYFIQYGMHYTINSYSEVKDENFSTLLSVSNKEMYGTIYTNNTNFYNAILGIGYKKNDNYISLRFKRRVLGDAKTYPDARMYVLELMVAKTLNFQKLRKGYKLYLND